MSAELGRQEAWVHSKAASLSDDRQLTDHQYQSCKASTIRQTSERIAARSAQHEKHYATQNRKRKRIDTPIKPPAENCIKYRLYPNAEQWKIIRKAFGVCGWLYNRTRDYVVNNPDIRRCEVTVQMLRSILLNNNSALYIDNPWAKEIPTDMREGAVQDFVQGYQAVMTKVQRGALRPGQATFSYRSRKQPSRRIVLNSKHYKSPGVFFPTIFGRAPFRSSESLPARLEYDSSLQLTWLGHLYICVPRPIELRRDNQAPRSKIVRSTPAAAHLRQRTTAYACRNRDRTTWRASIGWDITWTRCNPASMRTSH